MSGCSSLLIMLPAAPKRLKEKKGRTRGTWLAAWQLLSSLPNNSAELKWVSSVQICLSQQLCRLSGLSIFYSAFIYQTSVEFFWRREQPHRYFEAVMLYRRARQDPLWQVIYSWRLRSITWAQRCRLFCPVFSTHPETDPDSHHQVEVEVLMKPMTLTSAAKPQEVWSSLAAILGTLDEKGRPVRGQALIRRERKRTADRVDDRIPLTSKLE